MLKKFLAKINFKKSMLVFKAAVLIIAFIALGNLIAHQSGITEQLSKVFYWPGERIVAGEFTVRVAQASQVFEPENLSRSLIALPQDGKVFLGWRFFKSDDSNTNFNIYRNNQKIATVSDSTNYLDKNVEPGKTYRYFVKPVLNSNEGASSNEVSVAVSGRRDYISIPLRQKTTVANIVTGDLDGDGLLDWVIKIPEQINDDPQRDTYHLQAYRSNGEFLWDFDLGIGNDAADGGHIWANAYTLWDLDGNKKAEVIARIRHNEKYYLAIIDGITKNIKKEIEWPPQASWNQVREVLAIAYLNGANPYIVLQIGTYGTVNLYAYDSNLNLYWKAHNLGDAFSSHGIYVIDYDFDGNDELLVGDNLIDENGKLVWSQNLTHPDGVHPGNIDPNNSGYEVAFTMEGPWQMDKAQALVVDMASGKVLWQKDKFDHLHSEGFAADVTDQYPGWEFFSHDTRAFHKTGDVNHNGLEDAGEKWAIENGSHVTEDLCPYTKAVTKHNCMYVFSARGEIIYDNWIDGPPIWWDDNNLWEFLHLRYPDEPRIVSYPNSVKKNFGNVGAAHISIVGDFLGDFRDEFVVLVNGNELRIYTNTDVSNKKLPTPIQDRYYRLQLSRTGVGYYTSGGQLLDPISYFNSQDISENNNYNNQNENNNEDSSRTASCWDPIKGHCYPRRGVFQWGGAPAAVYARYDLVMFSSTDAGFVQQIKDISPHTIVLNTVDWNVAAHLGSGLPEPFRLKTAAGDTIGLYGTVLNPTPDQISPNISDACPVINGQKFNQWFAEYITNRVDLNVFDGLASDGLWAGWHMQYDEGLRSIVDLDRNGETDVGEYGNSWVNNQWNSGVKNLLQNIRTIMGQDKYLLINSGGGYDGHPDYSLINGAVMEFNGPEINWDYRVSVYKNFVAKAVTPQIPLFATNPDSADPNRTSPLRDYFTAMRFGLVKSMLEGGYHQFEPDDNPIHYFFNYYDEYDLNVGWPTSDMQEIGNSDIWVRFFDYGVAIMNVSGSPKTISDSDLNGLIGYKGPYYRFQGGQDPDFNNGDVFGHVELFGNTYINSYDGNKWKIGDGIILTKDETVSVADIIIDDDDTATSPASKTASYNGNWTEEFHTNGNFTLRSDGSHNMSAYRQTSGNSSATATFTPTTNVPGEYEVFEWHGKHDGNEATNVSYTIISASATETKTINQQQNQSQWNSLGKYTFNQGISGNVTISSQGANGIVIADAIKFVYQGNFGNIKGPPGAQKHLVADFNCDNQVNIQDFGILLSHWQKTQTQGIMDYKHSNCKEKRPIEIAPMNNSCALTSAKPIIDAIDIGMLLSCWGTPKDDGGSCCWKE